MIMLYTQGNHRGKMMSSDWALSCMTKDAHEAVGERRLRLTIRHLVPRAHTPARRQIRAAAVGYPQHRQLVLEALVKQQPILPRIEPELLLLLGMACVLAGTLNRLRSLSDATADQNVHTRSKSSCSVSLGRIWPSSCTCGTRRN